MVMTLLLGALLMLNSIGTNGTDTPFLTGIKNADDFTKQQEDASNAGKSSA